VIDLFLIGQNGFVAKVHKDIDITRDWCRIFGNEYKSVAPNQFRLAREGLQWKIYGYSSSISAFNPTHLNNKDVTGIWALVSDDDVISVGKLKLRVKLVPREDRGGEMPRSQGKRIHFEWMDHFKRSWHWAWDLQESVVREAAREFGITKPFVTPGYLHKKGFRMEGRKVFVDYPKVTGRNLERMRLVARSLFALGQSAYGSDKYRLLAFILSFVQSIPYMVPPEYLLGRDIYSFFTPPEVLFYGFGDCDSKCVLMATLWRNIYPEPLAFILLPEHLALGVSGVSGSDDIHTSALTHIKSEGKAYMICEPAGPALLVPGNPGKEFKASDVHSLLEF
jgi:hypothetical protein